MASVLIVDDDAIIRRLLARSLEVHGHAVEEAADGADAISMLYAGQRFDVVVTDYAMPRATGIEVIEAAQGIDPTLPCLIITAFSDMELATRAMAAGAVGFIPKPFRPSHLAVAVERAVERRRLADEAVRLRVMAPMLERFTIVLANTIEAKDLSTHRHCERLAAYADQIAAHLGMLEDRRAIVRLGACLHDVGKVGIAAELLQKRGPLTEEEWEVMRTHSEIGARILHDIAGWEEARGIIRHHHEHFDGRGYPDGLRGGDIPLGARIVAVVDAFDVMLHGRVYAAPRPLADVVGELVRLRGRQFDPEVVDIFVSLLQREAPVELTGMRLESPVLGAPAVTV